MPTSTKAKVKATTRARAKSVAKTPAACMSLGEVMRALEKAGTAQTKKTYARHGAVEPMYGASSPC